MKTKMLTTVLSVLALGLSTANSGFAAENNDTTSIVVDTVVLRPVSLALTIIGSAVFVVALPVAIPAHSVDRVGHALVVSPAKDTFVRPVGDLDDYMDY